MHWRDCVASEPSRPSVSSAYCGHAVQNRQGRRADSTNHCLLVAGRNRHSRARPERVRARRARVATAVALRRVRDCERSRWPKVQQSRWPPKRGPCPRRCARAMLRVALQVLRRRGPAGSGCAAPAAQRRMCTEAGGEAAEAAQLPFARELLRCRTTKEFTSYAQRRGAVVTRQKGSHATLTGPNGVTYTRACPARGCMRVWAR